MGKINNYANKPLDRDYFKRKENPNNGKGKKLTDCCQQDVDHVVLNVNNEEEWEIIEEYVEKHLTEGIPLMSNWRMVYEELGG